VRRRAPRRTTRQWQAERLVLLLFISGHSYDEIATDHDLSATAVNKALVRARRHLRAVHDLS
jgi:DNA-directed RNA polymerase specialized sigma24 family protein